ncbi:hypothetical protein EI42_06304 [Thermosporothrix hazakensis]|jgi:hypothetical protein|uniref:Uncharacterized protein n=1 Tax=Thermosporothrix hazakensis TaxID=644383 RepID=A0A326U3N4_THEHA|nr:hypothetical protein [Thermosporothrix hazakensis]PZW18161.1 hypothetical protein EI42_06304 [Thermosporothrix hazakensis]GCE47514.1 hypothetical protein KTH_23830 [Thermosporothrix hazakensis]
MMRNIFKKPITIVFLVLVVCSIALAFMAYRFTAEPAHPPVQVTPTPTPTAILPFPSATPKTNILPPVENNPAKVLGIEGSRGVNFQVPWVRVPYATCGTQVNKGTYLQKLVEDYHKQKVRVLLTVCQTSNDDKKLYDTRLLGDAARSLPDAVQCGNEQMKNDPSVAFLHLEPAKFARFYDLCERTMHSFRKGIPTLLGSLDPQVARFDVQNLYGQVAYLDEVQAEMQKLHPKSNWQWRQQAVGLIDSWHNGWSNGQYNPDENNLRDQFAFWAQQFGVDINSGKLGQHLWVVEGTACFKGCGVNENDPSEIAKAHIFGLIVDVQTAMQYKVPFFYFSGRDFFDQGIIWPIGVADPQGKAKPLRQDLAPGSMTLELTCGGKKTPVRDQIQLLSQLYKGCSLPGNYVNILVS